MRCRCDIHIDDTPVSVLVTCRGAAREKDSTSALTVELLGISSRHAFNTTLAQIERQFPRGDNRRFRLEFPPMAFVQLALWMFWAVRALCEQRMELAVENLAYRQQLASYERKGRRPRISRLDRVLWAFLYGVWSPGPAPWSSSGPPPSSAGIDAAFSCFGPPNPSRDGGAADLLSPPNCAV